MSILIVGSLNMDLVMNLDRMPNPNETVLSRSFSTFPGGKGLNQAVATKRAGSMVRMIGALGNDSYSEDLRESLKREGIDDSCISNVEETSGLAIIEVDDLGQNRIVVIPGANASVKASQFEANDSENYLLAQLEIPISELEQILKNAKKFGYRTVLNPAPAAQLSENFLSCVDVMIPNEHEAFLMTGIKISDIKTATLAGKDLISKGVGEVVITLAEKGALYISENQTIYQKAFKVEPIDTTAAGDAFCGGLISELARGCSMEQALKFAAAAGALTTTRAGATPSLPYENEIRSLLIAQGE